MLERSNLFLVALDDRRRWYRYHHLFGDVLRARLERRAPRPRRRAPPAGQRLVRGSRRPGRGDPPRARRPGTTPRPPSWSSSLSQSSVRPARTPPSSSGSTPCPRRCSRTARCSTSPWSVPAWSCGDTAGVEELLDGIEAWLEPDRSADELIVHHHAEFARLPTQAAMYRAGARAAPRRPRRDDRPRRTCCEPQRTR